MAELSDLTDADFEALDRGDIRSMSDAGLDILDALESQSNQANLTSSINAAVQENLNPSYAPGSAPMITNEDPVVDEANFAGQGFKDAIRRQKIGLGQTLNEGLGMFGLDTDKLPRAQDARDLRDETRKYDLTPSQYPGYKAGSMAGSAFTAAPMLLATKNPAALGIGGALGFTQPTLEENDLATRGINTAMYGGSALLGNMAGQGINAGMRGLLNPRIQPGAAELTQQGVQLTPGQFRGGLPKTMEDLATSMPFFGDKITDARMASIEGFNLASLNNALVPINKRVTKVGNEGFDDAQGLIGEVYEEAYKALPVVKVEAASGQELADSFFGIQGGIIKKGSLKDYNRTMTKEFYDQFDLNKSSGIPGRAWGDVQKNLRDRGFKILKTDQELGQALIDTSAAMNEMAARTSGEFGTLLKSANAAHRNMRGVRNATASAGTNEGVFMPSQLLRGIKKSDGSPDKLSFAKGNMPLQSFAQDGQRLLPSKRPDSGTPQRQAIMSLAAGTGLGVGGSATIGAPATAALVGGLLGARNLYRPGAMNFINKARNRPDWIRAAGEGFNLPPGLSAAGGTGLLGGNFSSDPLLRDGGVY